MTKNCLHILINRIFLILTICSISLHLFSQHFATKFYSSKDFPNINLVNALLIDDKGTLWIGSYSFGLTKFDGKDFSGLNQKTGLVSDRVIRLIQDKEGAIWAGDGEFGYSRIQGEKITNFHARTFGVPLFGDLHYFNSTKEILLTPIHIRSLSFDYQLNRFTANPEHPLDSIISNHFTLISDSKKEIIWFKKNSGFIYKNKKITPLKVKVPPITSINPVLFKNQIIYVNDTKLLCKSIEDESNSFEILCDIIPTAIDFIGTVGNEFVLFYKKNSQTTVLRSYTNELNTIKEIPFKSSSIIYSFTKDKAGNYWVGVHNGLIKIIPSLLVFSQDEDNMPTNVLSTQEDNRGQVWFGAGNHGISVYDGQKIIPVPSINAIHKDILDCSLLDRDGNVLFNTASGKKGLLSISSVQKYELLNKGTFAYFISRNNHNKIMLGMSNYGGVWISKNDPIIDESSNWIKYGKEKGLRLQNVLTASEDRLGNYWMGRNTQGISVYMPKTDSIRNYLMADNPLNPGAMSSTSDEFGNIWFGTNKGLYYLDLTKWKLDTGTLLKYLQLISPEILGVELIPALKISKNNLYIGTNTSVAILDLKLFYKGQISITSLNSEFGYEGGALNQNGLSIGNDDRIWITGSQNVTCHYPKLYQKDTTVPIAIIDEIRYNKEVIKITDQIISFPKGTTSLNIKVHAENCPFLYDNIHYIFKINNSEFTKPQDNSLIELRHLSPGPNKIEIQAIKNGSILSPIASYSFYIKPYWWENKWLWWVLGITIFLLSIFLYQKNIEMARQKNVLLNYELEHLKKRKENAHLQIQAIINQLNPHFVKNAIQWVQIRIAKDKEATTVLGKLERNINIVFTNTKQNRSFHRLEDEIVLVNNYLYIQKKRFGDRIAIPTLNNEAILRNLNMYIPLMILQIHCENACEHGTKKNPRSSPVEISLHIKEEPDFLHFIVEDTGVGRAMARLNGSEGTQRGVKMIEELIEIYNPYNSLPMKQWYDDGIFEDEFGQYGTRVHILIPRNFNFNIA